MQDVFAIDWATGQIDDQGSMLDFETRHILRRTATVTVGRQTRPASYPRLAADDNEQRHRGDGCIMVT